MGKKAFDKIAAGLNEALEIARGRAKRTPREAAVERIANLAGVDAGGGILPPDTAGGIDRTPSPWWKS